MGRCNRDVSNQYMTDSGFAELYSAPTGTAWRDILHLRAPPSMSETFSMLFPGTGYIQERQFSRLHRLVIGLETGSVEQELVERSQSVHALDLDGWKPLH